MFYIETLPQSISDARLGSIRLESPEDLSAWIKDTTVSLMEMQSTQRSLNRRKRLKLFGVELTPKDTELNIRYERSLIEDYSDRLKILRELSEQIGQGAPETDET